MDFGPQIVQSHQHIQLLHFHDIFLFHILYQEIACQKLSMSANWIFWDNVPFLRPVSPAILVFCKNMNIQSLGITVLKQLHYFLEIIWCWIILQRYETPADILAYPESLVFSGAYMVIKEVCYAAFNMSFQC